jgi:acetolactate synthase-1/2/3 large subunit
MSPKRVYFSEKAVYAERILEDFEPDGDPSKKVWSGPPRIAFESSYNPALTYPEIRTEVAVGWSSSHIYFAFWCKYTELNIYEGEDPSEQRWELWDRDVAEVFINPFPEVITKYWEFEVAPNNQWIDLEIDLEKKPFHDAGWSSGFEHKTSIDEGNKTWFCEMKIPAAAFGLDTIEPGGTWRVNFYRCDGPGDDSVRRFLAWSPTYNENFHVPESFGQLVFVDSAKLSSQDQMPEEIKVRTKDRGADVMVETLKAHGIEQIMAVTGGAIMEGMDAFGSSDDLRLLICQTEGGACWSAMGYSRVTGKPGICAVTSGPGATNTVTAISDAMRDNVSFIVITGQVPSIARNTDAFQETNITEIAAPTAKKVYYLSKAEEIARVFTEALRITTEGRPGPVLIDITKDAQQTRIDWDPAEMDRLRNAVTPSQTRIPEEELDEVVDCLEKAERPVVIVGYGVVQTETQGQLRNFLDVVRCPVAHTLPGKAGLPTAHPLNYGMLGMHGFYVTNWMVHQADLVISFGSRYDDRITGDTSQFAPQARKLIHFDIATGQVEKVLPERKLGVVGDLRETLNALNERLQGRRFDFSKWRESVREFEERHPRKSEGVPGRMQIPFALETLNKAVNIVASNSRPVTFATEVGDHQMWSGQFVALKEGWRFLTSSGQGAMGSGLPMAIGAQVAQPDALVVCIAGDGSLRMSEAELETVWEMGLPVKIMVMNNGGYGIVRMWNHLFYEGRETGVVKRGKNWTLLAQANGFRPDRVDRVTDPTALEAVLNRALAHREPHLIEIVAPYEECLPLWPPGKTFEDIIL